MKKILCSCFLILFIHISFAQIIDPNYKSVYFSYDEAGNQILREANSLEISKNSNEKSISIFNDEISPEDLFFEQINFFPIPVIDNLTIKWTNEINGEIFSFGIYDHNQLSYFYKENSKSLNGQIDINMTSYKSGIYIIQFTLTDGRIYAKSIIKK